MKKPRAAIRLSTEAVAGLLHLREGLKVTGARFDFDTQGVIFYLEGPGVGPCDVGPLQHAPFVRLTEVMSFDFS